MIKAIIFDFDGVIHDTLELTFNVKKAIHPDITLDEYKNYFNGNLYENPITRPEPEGLYFSLQNLEFKELIIEREIKKELLKMKEKFDLFIISSNMEITLNNYFENNNIIHIFKKVLGVETSKSKVEKFKILQKHYHLTKENSIFVTDTLGDILEANKVGFNTIAVDFGFHERERLEKGKPMKIISDFKELLPLIGNIK